MYIHLFILLQKLHNEGHRSLIKDILVEMAGLYGVDDVEGLGGPYSLEEYCQ